MDALRQHEHERSLAGRGFAARTGSSEGGE